jgi:hypothetical protein
MGHELPQTEPMPSRLHPSKAAVEADVAISRTVPAAEMASQYYSRALLEGGAAFSLCSSVNFKEKRASAVMTKKS